MKGKNMEIITKCKNKTIKRKAAKKPGPTKDALIKQGVAKGEFLVSTMPKNQHK